MNSYIPSSEGGWVSTHVSLLPPHCDEFTTKEPSFNATLVKPPGTISIPPGQHNAYGRRSILRR
ncbi:hypothetical protein [Ferruginibacter sp.]|uniref:hypothetical protein n=1 Tax=Ferruginibacter sp. TaxID=1940288 RepID=UPI0019860E63|nr:hypothetical protein [Ferruginibacter sp.]MBC7626209.1 hypothetical protein [Ferruginibacter sp.]